jgi:hypothetical protein
MAKPFEDENWVSVRDAKKLGNNLSLVRIGLSNLLERVDPANGQKSYLPMFCLEHVLPRTVEACNWITKHQEVVHPNERKIKWANIFYLEDLFLSLDQAVTDASDRGG